MKKLFLSLAVGALLSPAVTAREVVAYQTFETGAEVPFRGPVRFDTEKPSEFTRIADNSNEGIVYAGYYLNYHWIAQVTAKGTQSTIEGLYDINLTTGERTKLVSGGSKLIDLTYDYATGTVWGIRNGNTILATLDPATGENTARAILNAADGKPYMIALAADLDGQLWGIDTSDKLWKIDSETGWCTLVGELGVDAGFDQSMAFDHNDGTLYWMNNGDHNLYTVDTTTGAATLLGTLGNGQAPMASLIIPYINVAVGAPDRVTDLTVTPSNAGFRLEWTNPSVTAQGKPLTGSVTCTIERDGIYEISFDGQPGERMSYDDPVVAGGEHTYRVIPSNAAGEGGVDPTPVVVRKGQDLPGEVQYLNVERGDGEAYISWAAPATGQMGQAYPPEDVTGYIIKRDDVGIATLGANETAYTDRPAKFGSYVYSVAATCSLGAGTDTKAEAVMVKPADWLIMTDGTEVLASDVKYKFYDNGGPEGYYTNNCNYTLTLRPEKAGSYVRARFTKFAVDNYGDKLSVYDGVNTQAPLIGAFDGTAAVPAALVNLESTAADGSLTFVFRSDVMGTFAGWEADVTVAVRHEVDLAVNALSAPVMAVAGAEGTYTITVANKGMTAAKGYKVVLKDGETVIASAAGPDLDPAATAEVQIAYTPETAGVLSLSAAVEIEGDGDLTNNATTPKALDVLAPGSVCVEANAITPAELYVLPLSFMAKESVSQILLPAADFVSVAGKNLKAVIYPYFKATANYEATPIRLLVGEVEYSDLKDVTVPASALTEVFDGTIDVLASEDALRIDLSNAYEYKGGNLVVMTHKGFSETNGGGITFKGDYGYHGTWPGCSRFGSRYDDDFDPIDFDNIGYGGNDQRPDMLLIFSDPSGVETVVAPGAGFAVENGMLVTSGPARVYTTDGRLVANIVSAARTALPTGLYIVATPAGSAKVQIK